MRIRATAMSLLVVGLVATACTSSSSPSTSTVATTVTSTTSTVPESTTTTTETTTTTTTTIPELEPPEIGDPDEVARSALQSVEGFSVVFDTTDADLELFDQFDSWLPDVAAKGMAVDVVVNQAGDRVVAVSISPLTGLRGYPWIAAVFAFFANEGAVEPPFATDIVEVEATSGGTFFMWGEGDGVIVTTSHETDAAREYLERSADADGPNDVWPKGSCIYLPEDEPDIYGTAPWAPFPLDFVVPCSEPHNAEVILSSKTGTDMQEFDGIQITYDRAYECDKAYAEEFDGHPQGEYLPSMITYMPDVDEWDRGDRYLACLVYIEDTGGSDLLFTGNMRDLDDLDVSLEPGTCTGHSGKFLVPCGAAHPYQYLGSVEYTEDSYGLISDDLEVACEDLGDGLTEATEPVLELAVIGFDPGPYQFTQGYRTIHCYAAVFHDEDGIVDVTGSFSGTWRVVDEDSVSS